MVQRLRLHTPSSGGPVSIPGQGTRSYKTQLKDLHATAKTWRNQIHKQNKYLKNSDVKKWTPDIGGQRLKMVEPGFNKIWYSQKLIHEFKILLQNPTEIVNR